MSLHTLTGFAPTCASHIMSEISNRLTAVRAAFNRYLVLQQAHAELASLDDRMLKDIGLNRSEITSVLCDRTGERTIVPEPNYNQLP